MRKMNNRQIFLLFWVVLSSLCGCSIPSSSPLQPKDAIKDASKLGKRFFLSDKRVDMYTYTPSYISGSLIGLDKNDNFVMVKYEPEQEEDIDEVIDFWTDEFFEDFPRRRIPDVYCIFSPQVWPQYTGEDLEYARGFYFGWSVAMDHRTTYKHRLYPVIYILRMMSAINLQGKSTAFLKGYENGEIHAVTDFVHYCRELLKGDVRDVLPSDDYMRYLPMGER